MAKVKRKKVKTKSPEIIPPKHLKIVDLYLTGSYKNYEIAKKFKVRIEYVSRVINDPIVKKYIADHYKTSKEIRKRNLQVIYNRLIKTVERQVAEGKKKTKTYYNKKGEMTSQVVTITELSVSDLMKIAKLVGEYNPTVKVHHTNTEDKQEEDYKEILNHLKIVYNKH